RLEQARQDVVDVGDRKRVVGAVVGDRPLGSGARSVPQLALGIALAAEEQELALRPARREHGDGLGLLETGQVIEVAVRTIVEQRVAAAYALGRGNDDGDALRADDVHERLAPLRELAPIHSACLERTDWGWASAGR